MTGSSPRASYATFRLCVMMFLQFFIWGVWYVPMYPYLVELGIAPELIGWAYASTGIAAMVSPFFVGMIADRFFPSQMVMGVLHLAGGVFLLLASRAEAWAGFFPFLLLHLLCYMPTLALANSVLFQNVKDPQQHAPPIRTLGTIGWIASGVVVGSSFLAGAAGFHMQVPRFLGGPAAPEEWIALGRTHWPLVLGAAASGLLGLYCFTLPHTPPQLKGQRISVGDVLGLKALRLMRDRSFAVFIICSLLICIPLSFYFQSTNGFLQAMGVPNSEGVMTLGQVSEIFFLFLVPFFFRKLGVKKMLLIGMLFWVLRYLLFANATPQSHALLYLGVLFHGICYDFFFFTGQLYVDRRAPQDVRASAQGFIAFVTLGVGMFIGGILNGWWNGRQTTGETVNWPAVWYFPAIMAAAVLVAFFILFRDKQVESGKAS
ncbi:MAG TPA: MFS transporter [Verrucomicrobiales bacterium]|nr:MFS transporter [Verrucomicrobiales bacterium]